MPATLKTSGEPILTSGLNSTTEWGLYSSSCSTTININQAPILVVFNVTSSYGSGTAYDGQAATIVNDGTNSDGWGISHTYIPSGANSLKIVGPYGCGIFYGDKRIAYRLSNLTADRDGYIFVVTDTTVGYLTITKNGVTQSAQTVRSASNGWGMSYAAIPVVVGDEITVSHSYAHAVIY